MNFNYGPRPKKLVYVSEFEALERRSLAAEQERDQLKATNTRLNRRVQAMESKHPERSTLWGSDNTLRLEITRLHKELVAAHKGAATYSWICWKRLDEKDQLKAELQQAREAVGFNPHFDFDDEVRWILGRPGFTVRDIAEALRADGQYKFAKKHEDEQAVAIHWMLTLYRKHGLEWRAKGDAEIRAILERIKKEKPLPG